MLLGLGAEIFSYLGIKGGYLGTYPASLSQPGYLSNSLDKVDNNISDPHRQSLQRSISILLTVQNCKAGVGTR